MKKRVNISVEEEVLNSMDEICEKWGFNRSEFIAFLFFLFTNTTKEMHNVWEGSNDKTNKSN